MRTIRFTPERAEPITQFGSAGAASVHLADGEGASHAYCLHFAPGGAIGPHVAGFGQLFLVVAGEAWAAGADGERAALAAGEGAVFERGELHSKGSERGATVIMVQMREMSADPAIGRR
jgi:quercetin dioxygenase-like cupin family protein